MSTSATSQNEEQHSLHSYSPAEPSYVPSIDPSQRTGPHSAPKATSYPQEYQEKVPEYISSHNPSATSYSVSASSSNSVPTRSTEISYSESIAPPYSSPSPLYPTPVKHYFSSSGKSGDSASTEQTYSSHITPSYSVKPACSCPNNADHSSNEDSSYSANASPSSSEGPSYSTNGNHYYSVKKAYAHDGGIPFKQKK